MRPEAALSWRRQRQKRIAVADLIHREEDLRGVVHFLRGRARIQKEGVYSALDTVLRKGNGGEDVSRGNRVTAEPLAGTTA